MVLPVVANSYCDELLVVHVASFEIPYTNNSKSRGPILD